MAGYEDGDAIDFSSKVVVDRESVSSFSGPLNWSSILLPADFGLLVRGGECCSIPGGHAGGVIPRHLIRQASCRN